MNNIKHINDKISYIIISRTSFINGKYVSANNYVIIYNMTTDEFKNIHKMIYNNSLNKLLDDIHVKIMKNNNYDIYDDFNETIINLIDSDYLIYFNAKSIVNNSDGYGMRFKIYKISIEEFIDNLTKGIINYNEFIDNI